MKKIAYKNLGCKVNSYELEKIKRDFFELGYLEVPFDEKADIYIVNTCSVTNVADRKSRQMLNRCKKENNKALVVAIGCFVDANPEYKAENIDIYIKNENKKNTAQIVKNYLKETNDSKKNCDRKEEIRQVIKIEDGCNQFCSYCIIPYLRGRVRSNSIESVMSDVKEAVSYGAKEIVLTGIHLSSYGLDEKNIVYESEEGREFAREKLYNLIYSISENENIERIRLGSLEPRLINEDFVKKINQGIVKEKLCLSFHLALQSGSDKVLKDMNRHYTKNDYKKAVDIIRNEVENSTITTDIIVGFPTESDRDFYESLEFAKSIKFYNPNVFKFSKRKNTKAYYMDDIDESIKNERVNIMINSLDLISQNLMNDFIGTTTDILVEEIKENFLVGYNREYFKVFVENSCGKNNDINSFLGKIINVKIYEKRENYLLAKK